MIIYSQKYYTKYNQIVKHYKELNLVKSKDSYTENHHIIPKCLGGADEETNFVRLPPRVHFLLHWMLVKIYDHHSLKYAFNNMCTQGNEYYKRPSSASYQYARKYLSKMMKENNPNKDGLQAKAAWAIASTERRENQRACMARVNSLHKSKPKELRHYECRRCKTEITRLEFIHHKPRAYYHCSESCRHPNKISAG